MNNGFMHNVYYYKHRNIQNSNVQGCTLLSYSIDCYSQTLGEAQVQCYRSVGCPDADAIAQYPTALECCMMDEALSYDSGLESCIACVGTLAVRKMSIYCGTSVASYHFQSFLRVYSVLVLLHILQH